MAGGHRQRCDDVPAALARIREAALECGAVRLREEAHRLRGLFSTLSTTAGEAAARLETMGERGQQAYAASILDSLTELVGELGPLSEEPSIEELRDQAAGFERV